MIADVQKIFDAYLTTKLSPKPEILKFVLHHERKNLCLENLCGEIKVCEWKLGSQRFDLAKYKLTIEEVAKLFAATCLKAKGEELLTRNERIRRIDEASQYEELSKEIKEGQEKVEEL